MRDFTLDDFDRLFGADIDGMGTVSLDEPYIVGDDAVFNAVSGEDGRLVRARRYTPAGHAQTGGGFFVRRAWVPGGAVSPCAILSGGSLIYRRGAVYTATACAVSGETFNYINSYIVGDAAALNAVSGEDGRLVRARRYAPEGHAQTGGAFFTRRAWVPGNAIVPCAILSGGSLIYRRGAVYTATAGAVSGETFNYIRVRFFACPDEWGSGQALKFAFRGWAWSPEDRASGVWTEDERPNGVWVRAGTFSQQTEEVLSSEQQG